VISSARRISRRPQRDLGDRDSTTRVGSGPRATEANFCSTPTTCVSAAAWQNARNVKLRNAHLAIVDSSKVLDYLLNEAHPDNGGKARFFGSLGYSREDPDRLMQALREVAEHGRSSGVPNRHTAKNMLLMGGCQGTLKRVGSGRSGPFGSSTAEKMRRGS
jgi:hypothetical protein